MTAGRKAPVDLLAALQASVDRARASRPAAEVPPAADLTPAEFEAKSAASPLGPAHYADRTDERGTYRVLCECEIGTAHDEAGLPAPLRWPDRADHALPSEHLRRVGTDVPNYLKSTKECVMSDLAGGGEGGNGPESSPGAPLGGSWAPLARQDVRPGSEGSQPATAAREVVHACPIDGSGVTPCCGHPPFELDRHTRMTLIPGLVTCGVTR